MLGDIIINILNNSNRHRTSILSQYELIVTEAILISSSLIGHVFVRNHFLQKLIVEKTEIISIYFSDHNAVKFKLEWR